MQPGFSDRIIRVMMPSTVFSCVFALIPLLADAQNQHTIVANSPVPVCMRPIGGGTGDVGMEGIFMKCENTDSVLWTEIGYGLTKYSWYKNVNSGKCLHVEGVRVLQRTCDIIANNADTTHPQLWTVNFVRRSDSGVIYRQMMHQQQGGGVMCLATSISNLIITNNGTLFSTATMSMDNCILPPSNAPATQQFVSGAFR